MAIGASEPVAEIVSTSNASTYDFGSFTPTADAILVVLALCRGTVDDGAITNVSGTSLTWTRKTSAAFNGGADTVYCFWARVPTSPAASVYRVDLTGDAATGCIAYMFQFTGALSSGDPIIQTKTNSATSTNPTSGSLTQAMNTNNGYCAAWMGALSSSNPANVSTPPDSWTEVGDNGFNNPTSNGTGAFRAGGETASSVTFTASSTTWGLVFAEVGVENSVTVGAGAGPINVSTPAATISGEAVIAAAAAPVPISSPAVTVSTGTDVTAEAGAGPVPITTPAATVSGDASAALDAGPVGVFSPSSTVLFGSTIEAASSGVSVVSASATVLYDWVQPAGSSGVAIFAPTSSVSVAAGQRANLLWWLTKVFTAGR